jgi:tRNA A-37 threonylcarbamoyl transferase component Bud32
MGTHLVFVDDDMARFLADMGLREFDDFFALKGAQCVRNRESASLHRTTLVCGARQEAIFVKTQNYLGLPRLRRMGPEKADREARNYAIMVACGIETPHVICYGQRRRGGFLMSGLLVTREVPNGVGLEDWFAQRGIRAPHERHRLLRLLARVISRMHACGFYHIDLQWRNIKVAECDDRSPRIVLLDSARGGRRRWPASREYGRARDLSSLFKDARRYLTRSEMVRWLREYLDVPRLGAREKQLIWTIFRDRSAKDNPRA